MKINKQHTPENKAYERRLETGVGKTHFDAFKKKRIVLISDWREK
jgi:hypothetical protein